MVIITKRRFWKAAKFLIIGCCIYIALGYSVSIIFPKKIFFIDNLRLFVQGKILTTVADYNNMEKYQDLLIDGKEIQYIVQKLTPGDIIFAQRAGYVFSNALIAGKRKHAAIYLGTQEQLKTFLGPNNSQYESIKAKYIHGDEVLILDGNRDGVDVRDIRYLTHIEAISGIRINRDEYTRKEFLTKVIQDRGKPYDFDFDLADTNAIFCAELIFQGLKNIGIGMPSTEFLNRKIVYPNEIMSYIVTEGFTDKEFTFLLYLDKIQDTTKYFSQKTLEENTLQKDI